MAQFKDREEYERWKAERSRQIAQKGTERLSDFLMNTPIERWLYMEGSAVGFYALISRSLFSQSNQHAAPGFIY